MEETEVIRNAIGVKESDLYCCIPRRSWAVLA